VWVAFYKDNPTRYKFKILADDDVLPLLVHEDTAMCRRNVEALLLWFCQEEGPDKECRACSRSARAVILLVIF
jgi:hypothetical protein